MGRVRTLCLENGENGMSLSVSRHYGRRRLSNTERKYEHTKFYVNGVHAAAGRKRRWRVRGGQTNFFGTTRSAKNKSNGKLWLPSVTPLRSTASCSRIFEFRIDLIDHDDWEPFQLCYFLNGSEQQAVVGVFRTQNNTVSLSPAINHIVSHSDNKK